MTFCCDRHGNTKCQKQIQRFAISQLIRFLSIDTVIKPVSTLTCEACAALFEHLEKTETISADGESETDWDAPLKVFSSLSKCCLVDQTYADVKSGVCRFTKETNEHSSRSYISMRANKF